ncbi:MAG: DUF87 domain-containing protein [Candidatus Altiarchaeota archaeon]
MLQTHTLIAGATGCGKTVAAQVMIEEALLRDVAVIVFDPTAQWTGFLRPNQSRGMLNLYSIFQMKSSDARAFNGNVYVLSNPRQHIDIKKYINPGEITVFCLHKLSPDQIDMLVETTVKDVFMAHLDESTRCRVLIVYDEVHRLLPKFGGSGRGFIQIERAAREFRKWGVGLVLISQVLSDFVGEIKANIGTEIQMRTRYERDLERIRMKYGEDTMKSVVKANVGTGMLQNAEYNQGRPYFVSFRPLLHDHHRLSDDTLENYDKYNKKIEALQEMLDDMKEVSVDVFDLNLELGLALDNVKKGGFDVVELYLESIEPRIKEQYNNMTSSQKNSIQAIRKKREAEKKRRIAQEELAESSLPSRPTPITRPAAEAAPEEEKPHEKEEKNRGILEILSGIDKELEGIKSDKATVVMDELKKRRQQRRDLWDKLKRGNVKSDDEEEL